MVNSMTFRGLQKVSKNVFDYYNLRQHKVHRFQPKIEIENEVGPFIYRTVRNPDELIMALRLRYEVFHHEMIGKFDQVGIDVDEYDAQCDHLIIIEKRTEKIVGTYRLNCSLFSNDFYSAREFYLINILDQPGIKLELGRACIHKDFRRGIVISLLWKGIADYMAASQAQILFGCASIKTDNPRQASILYKHFESQGRLVQKYFAPPTLKYTMPGLGLWIQSYQSGLNEVEKQEAEALIPPLCRAYLKIGAYLGGEPAFDPEFNCIDFLTVLHRDDLNRTLWKRYKLDTEG